jgi:O-antigen/teichoic acid export membrane protein
MLKKLKGVDVFARNIIIVFTGTTLVNVINLLYQLLIAHNLSASAFASFNSLLSIFVLLSAPLATIQLAIAKYSAAYHAHNQASKIKFFLSDVFKKLLILSALTFLIAWPSSFYIIGKLKIQSVFCAYILAGLLTFSWFGPFFIGGVQGLERFGWLTGASVVSSVCKLLLGYIFIMLGFNIAGALGALFISVLIAIVISYIPLRKLISFSTQKEDTGFKQVIAFLFPLAAANFCFMALISSDMIMVKYFFPDDAAGVYSIAQMVGKIFIFLPGAVSMVMFPKVSAQHARNEDTLLTLKRSLFIVAGLSFLAALAYNLFPFLALRILTGKASPESAQLGRFFSFSMSFFTLLFVMISYFLSIKDFRFIKYLVMSALLQVCAVIALHQSLLQVQLILCVNSLAIFLAVFFLTYKKPSPSRERQG